MHGTLRRRGNGFTIVEFLICVAIVGILATLVVFQGAVGCAPEPSVAVHAAEVLGFSKVEILDRHAWTPGWHGCGQGDAVAYPAAATNPLNQRVGIIICCGSTWAGKGCTIRTP